MQMTIDVAKYEEGMSALWQSGILEFLKNKGVVQVVVTDSPNYIHLVNAAAHRSIGYNEALHDLLHYREKYIKQDRGTTPSMDYGSVDSLKKQGKIDNEQSEQLKRSPVFNP